MIIIIVVIIFPNLVGASALVEQSDVRVLLSEAPNPQLQGSRTLADPAL